MDRHRSIGIDRRMTSATTAESRRPTPADGGSPAGAGQLIINHTMKCFNDRPTATAFRPNAAGRLSKP
ncbi:hypothetical protein, partial [Paramuribaculum intestinale]